MVYIHIPFAETTSTLDTLIPTIVVFISVILFKIYSKQTVNSALKTLEARGLVTLVPSDGDRRSKLVSLSEAGRAFADERIRPAISAEDRAFTSLAPEDRAELVRLVRAYATAIDAELARLREGRASA